MLKIRDAPDFILFLWKVYFAKKSMSAFLDIFAFYPVYPVLTLDWCFHCLR